MGIHGVYGDLWEWGACMAYRQGRLAGFGTRVFLLKTLGRLRPPPHLVAGPLSGIHEPALVLLDAWQQPQIEAGSDHDLYFLQGYVHARDRFFQMDLARRMPAGRLAALLGPEALSFDRFNRCLNVAGAAEQALLNAEPAETEVLAAYCDGVNAALRDVPVPPEHRLLGMTPEPWKPVDTYITAFQLAWALNTVWNHKWARAELAGEVDALELVEGSETGAPAGLGGSGTSRGTGGAGSNNWVVSGRLTQSGRPLLANDPHLIGTLPSVWYPMRLRAPDVDVAGVSLAGAPGIIIGQTPDIAWGVTNVNPDVQDVIRITPDAKRQSFMTAAGRGTLYARSETLFVRRGRAESLLCWDTDYGPVIRELPNGQMLVLRWNALTEPPALRAVYRLNRARDWNGFEAALRDWEAPAQHFVYADRHDHIGYRLGGQVFEAADAERPPVLDAGRDCLDARVVMPFSSRPHVLDPDDGLLVTANNPPVSDSHPHRVEGAFTLGIRARRITERLRATKPHSEETFATLQDDVFAAPLLAFAQALLAHPELPAEWRLVLDGFDGRVSADSAAATHLHLLAEALLPVRVQEALGRPFFPDHQPGEPGSHPFPERFFDLVGERLVPWVTRRLPTLDLVRAAMAADKIGVAAFGPRRESWTWGRAHRLRLFHPFVGVPLLKPVFGRAEVQLGGDHTTVSQAAYPVGAPLGWPRYVAYLPSMRVIFDLSDPARSALVHLTGSSGHPLSPHYDDMLPAYLNNRRVPLGPGMEARERVLLTPGPQLAPPPPIP